MNRLNLIFAGILAQKTFNIDDGCRIIEVPPEILTYHIPVNGGYEAVNLSRVGFLGTDENIGIGYSKSANVLLISGSRIHL